MRRLPGEIPTLIICTLLDRITKWWALNYAVIEQRWTAWASAELAFNRGMAFSIGNAGTVFQNTIVFASGIMMLTICSLLLYRDWRHQKSLVPFGLVIVGATNNFVDRLLYGGVIDFIVLHYANWYWPTFNVADICICTGVGLLFFTKEL